MLDMRVYSNARFPYRKGCNGPVVLQHQHISQLEQSPLAMIVIEEEIKLIITYYDTKT